MTGAPDAPGPPLRVLVVGVSSPLETFLDRLFTGLAGRGVQLTVMSRTAPAKAWLDERGARWVHGPGPLDARALAQRARRSGARALGAPVADLAGRVASGRPRRGVDLVPQLGVDVIYAPWVNTLIDHPGLLSTGIPVLTSLRGRMITIDPWDPAQPGRADGLRAVFARVDRVHAVSQAITDEALQFGLDPSTVRVITPAVDPQVFRPGPAQPDDGPVPVLAVGSLVWRKDYEHALLALRKAVDLGADLELTIVGDGPDRQHVEFTVHDLDLGDRVRLAGRLPSAEVAALLRVSQVFLHTSASEGISNAVLEAMASEVPVVTSDAGGMGEAVRDGIDGFVVGVRDSAGFAAALHRLASDPGLRADLGAAARERVVQAFRLDQQLDAFGDLLAETAGVGR